MEDQDKLLRIYSVWLNTINSLLQLRDKFNFTISEKIDKNPGSLRSKPYFILTIKITSERKIRVPIYYNEDKVNFIIYFFMNDYLSERNQQSIYKQELLNLELPERFLFLNPVFLPGNLIIQ